MPQTQFEWFALIAIAGLLVIVAWGLWEMVGLLRRIADYLLSIGVTVEDIGRRVRNRAPFEHELE
jgi:hypothetical protein